MQKRDKKRYVKGIVSTQIFLLISAIFAFAFVLGESNSVSGQNEAWIISNGVPKKISLGEYNSNTMGSLFESEQEATSSLTKGTVPGGENQDNSKENSKSQVPTGIVPVGFTTIQKIFTEDTSNVLKTVKFGGQELTGKVLNINNKYYIQGADKKIYELNGYKADTGVANSVVDASVVPAEYEFYGLTGQDAYFASAVVYAAAAYGLGQMIGSFLGFDKKQSNALGLALGSGVATYQLSQGFLGATKGLTGQAGLIGAGVALLVFVATYEKTGKKTITFTCGAFEPPVGGAKCEECNKDKFRPCTEYRCKALGQACQLLNKEAPGKELCTWVNRGDSISPTITPSVNALSPSGLSYISDTSTRPPALGVKITRNSAGNGCLNAFTPLQFGINTNEPAQCKIDWNITSDFDSMQYYFGESYSSYNHTLKMRLPGPADFNNPEDISPIFKNDGTSQLFVRCRDANGNYNVDAYSIKFCVDKSPDTTPPSIEGTSIASGNPVKFGTQTANVEVYVNEPAECKWSVESKSYADMENKMSCATLPEARNAIMTWVCNTNLTGIKNNADNKYYLRCKDQPGVEESKRNVMVQSYEYVLKGSQELNIISVSPNSTVTGGTSSVNVELELETANGAEEGKAFCFFSPLGTNDSYVQMFETNNFKHKQTLQLTNGDYKYYFRCTDLGGNSAEAQTSFKVFSDTLPPKVARIYKEEGVGLKIVTDEDAECVYSLTGCNFKFDDGLKAIYSNSNIKTNSYVEWKPNIIYYMKCRDFYGNEPNPGECSAAVRAVEG